ncbi:uncharacterized protein FA14DRAFT_171449 [Meira miltonrushii]|uniref:BTB domain-containing protein n=1 Tax=Meira miltonrushii TaxID=1280837 RepID=A0A316VEH6_9BASI|nr:uncharacterized protein FA14DRAFT_171449 [Meira miltonrushii]PWN34693.1 hypothetical protein FA14DRAFT_171449 [Meira miltonrushii]
MTDTTSPKEAETTAIEPKDEKKEEDKIEHIIILSTRIDFNDVVLICKGDKEDCFIHFHVESAVLACVSSPFASLLTDCKNEKEDANTIKTFLNVVYGKPDLAVCDSFHHLFMVLELGDKFCATFVVDRMIFQLCEILRVYVEEQKPLTSRYSNAVILKLLSLCRKINHKQVLASQLAFNTLKSTILRHWHQYVLKCGAKFFGKCACSCRNCACVSMFCHQNRTFDDKSSKLSVDMFFPKQSSTEYFSALELLLFTNALKTYLHNGGDAEKALFEFLSPQFKMESNNAATRVVLSFVE